ncbi:MAG: diaminopimelate epimerase [Blastocatellia bacterium]|nr:diaminopimelate epimerase [Blastocatellia bacterium]
MPAIKFCKFHGFGNDYIVIEKEQIPSALELPDLARSICERHTGVGSDGIAVLSKSDGTTADYFCEIVNPDGSIAGFSGNGTRSAVGYLFYNSIWPYPSLKLETRSGIKVYTLIENEAEGHYWLEAEIGKPKFASDKVPVALETRSDSVVDHPLTAGGRTFLMSCVNVGNPVACTFVEDFDFDWRSAGRELEVHSFFPEKANIVFVKVIDRENIELRIWERAAGETTASGTCASGSAVLSAFTGRTDRTVSVLTEGGTTEVFWRKDDEILIAGRADLAFRGEWPV